MVTSQLIPAEEFRRVRAGVTDGYERLSILADMCRANTLTTIKYAGSGHIGSSFSALDIVTMLYYSEMNVTELGLSHPDRDIFFSSKGHDVPGLYAVLFSLGFLPQNVFVRLRHLGGTCGHPDVRIPGIEANSGSLGMGISKAKGMAIAKRLQQHQGRIFVMTGDGELQEGQIYEALQTAAHQGISNLHVLVDHNKVQSDKAVHEIIDVGDLEAKFQAFGWYVRRCDGHNFAQLDSVFTAFRATTDRPKLLIADTLKGRGVSFMEHPRALQAGGGLYHWHSGAPDDQSFAAAYDEIITRVHRRCAALALSPPKSQVIRLDSEPSRSVSPEYVAEAFGQELVRIAARRQDIVVLDADLAADCRLRGFETAYPERFIENGIAEQDMVSTAGGLALQGLLPVVNSFGAFLASRANEQIYTNAGEGTKIIYVCHYAGLLPAGPGQSHQSLRDIALFGTLPNCVILQPANAKETRQAVHYCLEETTESCMLRLIIGPSPRRIILPDNAVFLFGRGTVLTAGADAVLFAYGPTMLHEALTASELLAEQGFGLTVVNMPWLNRVDVPWLTETILPYRDVYVLEDHTAVGGLGDFLLNTFAEHALLPGRRLRKFAVYGHPAWGTPSQVLAFHGLDGRSLARRIQQEQKT
jgi:transketolase